MSDPTLILQENGGDLTIGSDGDLLVGNGLESAAVISMFGGNLDDENLPGTDGNQYWGNVVNENAQERTRSETQRLLETIPATTGNMLRLQDAIARDLAWMTDAGIVDTYEINLELVGVRRIKIMIDLLVSDTEQQLQFTREWTGNR